MEDWRITVLSVVDNAELLLGCALLFVCKM